MAPNTGLLASLEAPLAFPSLAGARRVDVLRLIRTPNVGPVTFFALLRRFGSVSEATGRLPELAARGGRKAPLAAASVEDAEKEIAAAEAFGARLILYGEADYPPLLHTIPDPPPALTVMGDAQLWKRQSIGIVGARNASANGCAFAQKLAAELGAAGLTVVSGLARGIDTFAHRGALASGTVAVTAAGIDVTYPPENDKLTKEIRTRGAVITEQPFGQAPFSAAFPGRNRIIAGMTLGTLIVEAAPKSGSLITARLAAEQGRDVFSVPGHPLDPRAAGCNRLLKNGAILVEDAADILYALSLPRTRDFRETPPPAFEPAPAMQDSEIADAQALVLAHLSPTPASVDLLRVQCGLTASQLLVALMELELAGRAFRLPGGMVALRVIA